MKECDYCGRERDDVGWCNDPYALRVDGVAIRVKICTDCSSSQEYCADRDLNN